MPALFPLLWPQGTPPPPTSRPPKVFELVFLQCEILGKSAGAKGTAEFFFWPPEWVIFFFTPWVYVSTQSTKKLVKNTKNNFDP